MRTTNYFRSGMDAGRYARARPHIHASVIEQFLAFTGVTTPVACALDVGCGTGQSTVALAAVAASIVGVDTSTEMLAHAATHPRVSYREASAEHIPFPDRQFDLITAGLAFHWFDAGAFLAESRRLLREAGWLIIYTSGFTGEMAEDMAFAKWFRDEFLRGYPTPPRNHTEITAAFAEASGLVLVGEEPVTNDVEMTAARFVDYELSTTNVIAAVERGSSAFEDVEAWMRNSLAPFFQGRDSGTFRFVGRIWYLQKHAA